MLLGVIQEKLMITQTCLWGAKKWGGGGGGGGGGRGAGSDGEHYIYPWCMQERPRVIDPAPTTPILSLSRAQGNLGSTLGFC